MSQSGQTQKSRRATVTSASPRDQTSPAWPLKSEMCQNRTYVLTATSVSRRAPRRLWSRLVSSLVCSLAGVHLSVVKLGHGTGLAPDGIARLVVIPPAVDVPRAARVVGPHCVVRCY